METITTDKNIIAGYRVVDMNSPNVINKIRKI